MSAPLVEARQAPIVISERALGASVVTATANQFEPGVRAVQAATFAWHRASVRVLEKVRMLRMGVREHETMGEMIVFERRPSI
jgi:RimJ/RimL family protein N-acetyltransferase